MRFNLGMIKAFTILLLLILVMPTLGGKVVKTYVEVNPATDGVLLNTHLHLRFATQEPPNISLRSVINVESTYIKNNLTVVMSGKAYIKSVKEGLKKPSLNSLRLYMLSNQVGLNGTFTLILTIDTVNGTVKVKVLGNSTSPGNVSLISITASIAIPRKAVPKNLTRYLPLLALMLNAEVINKQLELQNISSVRFKELTLSYGVSGDYFKLMMNASLRVNPYEYIKSLSKTYGQSMTKELIDLLTKLRDLGSRINQSFKFNLSLKTVSGAMIINTVGYISLSGELENYFRYLGNYVIKLVNTTLHIQSVSPLPIKPLTKGVPVSTAKVPSSLMRVTGYLSPWLKVVVLPSNASLKVNTSIHGSEATLDLVIRGLRLGHTELRGSEATREVARLVISAVEGIKRLGIPVRCVNNVEGVKPDPKLADRVAFIFSELKLRPYGLTITPTQTKTTPIRITVSMTKTLPLTITKKVITTYTKTLTTTKTIYKVLTPPTKILTITKYVTTTKIREVKVIGVDVAVILGASIVVAGLIIAYILKKR